MEGRSWQKNVMVKDRNWGPMTKHQKQLKCSKCWHFEVDWIVQAIHNDVTPWFSFIICLLLNCSEAQGTKTSQGQDHEHRPFIVWQFGPKRHFLQHVPDISVLETGAHLHEVPVAMNAKSAGHWLFSFDPFDEGVMEWCALKEWGDVQ